jgi:hypothetical protein
VEPLQASSGSPRPDAWLTTPWDFGNHLDPLDRILEPNPALNQVFLSAAVLLNTVTGGHRASPAQIATLSEYVFQNRTNGTCDLEAGISSFLGWVNGYDVSVRTFFTPLAHYSDGHDRGHAVTELKDGKNTYFLTWGKVWPSLASIENHLGPLWGPHSYEDSDSPYTLREYSEDLNYYHPRSGSAPRDIIEPTF